MANPPFKDVFLVEKVDFHCYISLLEGIYQWIQNLNWFHKASQGEINTKYFSEWIWTGLDCSKGSTFFIANQLKMYFWLKIVIFHCHVSFSWVNQPTNKVCLKKETLVDHLVRVLKSYTQGKTMSSPIEMESSPSRPPCRSFGSP